MYDNETYTDDTDDNSTETTIATRLSTRKPKPITPSPTPAPAGDGTTAVQSGNSTNQPGSAEASSGRIYGGLTETELSINHPFIY